MELNIYLVNNVIFFFFSRQWDLNLNLNLSQTGSKSYQTQSLQLLLGGKDCSFTELLRTRNLVSLVIYHPLGRKFQYTAATFWLEGTCSVVPGFQNAIIPLSKVYCVIVLASLTDNDVLLKTGLILTQGYRSAIGSCQKSSLKRKASRP